MSVCLRLLTKNHTHAWVTSEVIRGLWGDSWLQVGYKVSVPQWVVRLSSSHIPTLEYMTLASLTAIKGTFWQSAVCVLEHAYHFRLGGRYQSPVVTYDSHTHSLCPILHPIIPFLFDKQQIWIGQIGSVSGVTSRDKKERVPGREGGIGWAPHSIHLS